MRKYIVPLHRWVGLAVLAFIALAGITGSILAFDDEIDRYLNEDWFHVPAQAARKQSLDTLVPIAEAVFPGKRVTFLRAHEEADRAYEFYLRTPNGKGNKTPGFFEHASKYHQVFIDPYSGKVLGARENGAIGLDKRAFVPFMIKLHYTLVLGEFGKWFMGITALLWLLDHIGAVYLSFPNLRQWRKSFQFRWRAGGHKLNFDLHRSGGMWLLPVLLMLSLSSVYLNLNEQFKWVVNLFSPVTKVECSCKVDPNAPWVRGSGSWDAAVRAAREVAPSMTLGGVTFLPDTRKFIVSMKSPDDLTEEVGMTKVHVNAVNGEVMRVHRRSMESAGDTFMAWMLPLHSGRVFGLAGQILILLSGLIVVTVCVTGFLIYLKKSRARASTHARVAAAEQRPQVLAKPVGVNP